MSSEFDPSQLPVGEEPIRFGRFSFDPASSVLMDGETLVHLAPKTCELLGVFLRNPGKLLSKAEIMNLVWSDTFVEESNLTHHIASLRKALKDQAVIETMPRRGYRFSADIFYGDPVFVQRTEKRVVEVVEEFFEKEEHVSSRVKVGWLAVGFAVIAVAAVGYWAGFGGTSSSATSTTLALSLSGNVRSFAVSPDGKMIAFSWRQEGEKVSQLYTQLSSSGNPLKLTESAGTSTSPAWSPDGSTIAFLRSEAGHWSIRLIPALGGQERKLCDLTGSGPLDLTWSPDGNFFAVSDIAEPDSKSRSIILVSASDGMKRKLTDPPADANGDFVPAFSPDSRSIAFRRDASVASIVFRVNIADGDQRIIGRESVLIQSLIWPTPNNLVYAAKRGSIAELFSLTPSGEGTPKKLLNLSTQASSVSFGRASGNFYFLQNLSDVNVWETSLDPSLESVIEKKKLIASPREDAYARLSPDGQKIAFLSDRSGFVEIWLANGDGTGQSKLTDFSGPNIGTLVWSPDGSQIAIHLSSGENQDIYVVNAATGKAASLTSGGKHYVREWSLDGKSVYFTSSVDAKWQLSKKSAQGDDATVLVVDGANAGFETEDGAVIFCKMEEGGIWRKRIDGSIEEVVNEAEFQGVLKSSLLWPVDNGMIYFSKDAANTPGFTFFDLRNGQRRRMLSGFPQESIGLSISRDARRWFANKSDYSSAEVVRVDGVVF